MTTPEGEERATLARRRRGRNIALLAVLLALVALFYFISMARLARSGGAAPAALLGA